MQKFKNGCGCTRQRQNRWLEPSILFLLYTESKHGYTLMSELPELGFINGDVDPGAVYRTLRHLEEFQLVTSEWDTSGSGAAKRQYEITQAGKAHLQNWTSILTERKNNLDAFLKKINQLKGDK